LVGQMGIAAKNVLVIEPGGMHGYTSVLVLEAIEKGLEHRLSSYFDLVAGTSTGAIIASLISTGDFNKNPKYSVSEIRRFYEEIGQNIFNPSERIETSFEIATKRYGKNAYEELKTRIEYKFIKKNEHIKTYINLAKLTPANLENKMDNEDHDFACKIFGNLCLSTDTTKNEFIKYLEKNIEENNFSQFQSSYKEIFFNEENIDQALREKLGDQTKVRDLLGNVVIFTQKFSGSKRSLFDIDVLNSINYEPVDRRIETFPITNFGEGKDLSLPTVVRASSSRHGFFPPVEITSDITLFDGQVGGFSTLKAAYEAARSHFGKDEKITLFHVGYGKGPDYPLPESDGNLRYVSLLIKKSNNNQADAYSANPDSLGAMTQDFDKGQIPLDEIIKRIKNKGW
jgi:predicted acylesterase/phospholipase RssA